MQTQTEKIFSQPTLRTGKWNEGKCFEGKKYDRKMKFAFVAFEDINPGAGYVMSWLKKQGHDVQLFFDPKQGNRGYQQNKFVERFCNIQDWLIKEMKEWKPDIACFTVLSATYQAGVQFAERVKKEVKDESGNPVHIVFGGTMPTLVPEVVAENWFIDEVVQGDGVRHFGGKFEPDNLWPERDDFFRELPPEHRHTQLFMTSYGCPYNPLRGDTKVNTIYGYIPIKDIYERGFKSIPVYTYNFNTDRVEVSDAVSIDKYGKSELIRVNFTDGTHIDCSPEHRFWTFKIGNQYNGESYYEEKPIMAKELVEGQRIKAIRFEVSGGEEKGYFDVCWARRKRDKVHRILMEYKIGRRIVSGEVVHHKDGNRFNNDLDNLELFSCMKEHLRNHPEISERMKINNPMFNEESKKKRKTTLKKGWATGAYENHRVKSIQWLNETDDVYCMTLPKNGWFFANNVLVSNCTFCGNQQLREVGQYVKMKRTVESCIAELKMMKEKYGLRNVLFVDDILTLDKKWLMQFLPEYRKYVNVPFACFGHVNCIDEEMVKEMALSKCQTMWFGIQSGCPQHRKEILDRPETNEQIIKVAGWVKKYGIKLMVDHISGLPYESDMTHELSYNLYQQINADVINVYECLYFPKAKINEHALKVGYLVKDDIYKINRGLHVVYQQNNKGHHFYDKWAKSIVALPLGGGFWEFMPLAIIKLFVHLKAGRGYIANAMIQNEFFFTYRAILKKLGLMKHPANAKSNSKVHS
jgi:radical SAM superfamily enzyme YgiQ (UPF0313 family)